MQLVLWEGCYNHIAEQQAEVEVQARQTTDLEMEKQRVEISHRQALLKQQT